MTIPRVDLSDMIPYAPLHWTSIAHYLVLIMALIMLMFSGDKSPVVYLLILAVLALMTGADLYIGKYQIARILVFALPALRASTSSSRTLSRRSVSASPPTPASLLRTSPSSESAKLAMRV